MVNGLMQIMLLLQIGVTMATAICINTYKCINHVIHVLHVAFDLDLCDLGQDICDHNLDNMILSHTY